MMEPGDEIMHNETFEGWETLYLTYSPALYRFFYAYTRGNRALAEDLVQETFLAALRRRLTFDPRRGSFRQWLWAIGRNKLADAYRSLHRQNGSLGFEAIEHALAAAADGRPLPDELLQRDETRLRIGGALASLPPAYRDVLERKYIEGQSVREIAEAAGKTEKAVELQLRRARAAFRRQFEDSTECEV
jgi:RNA polymerase sigma-70 factor (ECF subfamily)